MREKLIELIRKAKKHTKDANCDLEREMIFADYLIENGVIVPPCKVGDTVYCVDTILKTTEKCKVYGVGFFKDKKIQLYVDDGECKYVTDNWCNTKEEAEEALKARAE